MIDDGSADASGAMCDGCAAHDVRTISIKLPHYGVAKARNYGLRTYTGEYLMLADEGDLPDRNYVHMLYDVLIASDAHVAAYIVEDI